MHDEDANYSETLNHSRFDLNDTLYKAKYHVVRKSSQWGAVERAEVAAAWEHLWDMLVLAEVGKVWDLKNTHPKGERDWPTLPVTLDRGGGVDWPSWSRHEGIRLDEFFINASVEKYINDVRLQSETLTNFLIATCIYHGINEWQMGQSFVENFFDEHDKHISYYANINIAALLAITGTVAIFYPLYLLKPVGFILILFSLTRFYQLLSGNINNAKYTNNYVLRRIVAINNINKIYNSLSTTQCSEYLINKCCYDLMEFEIFVPISIFSLSKICGNEYK